jgi:hypothetical protein
MFGEAALDEVLDILVVEDDCSIPARSGSRAFCFFSPISASRREASIRTLGDGGFEPNDEVCAKVGGGMRR